MFVRLSKYRKIVAEAATLTDQLTAVNILANRYRGFAEKWHGLAADQKKQIERMELQLQQLRMEVGLVRMSNAKAAAPQFTQEQIRTLITLCHPDKHGGKDSAKTMTQQLLQMRK